MRENESNREALNHLVYKQVAKTWAALIPPYSIYPPIPFTPMEQSTSAGHVK